MPRLLRAPLVHFVALGAVLLAVRDRFDPAPPPRPAVVIRSAAVARLAEAWTEEREYRSCMYHRPLAVWSVYTALRRRDS